MRRHNSLNLFGLAIFLLLAATTIVAYGLPDCNGTSPAAASCGTFGWCPSPSINPTTGDYQCGDTTTYIVWPQTITYKCDPDPAPGTGSTLCADVSTPNTGVCTMRYVCSPLWSWDTNGDVYWYCANNGTGVNNSFRTLKTITASRDTSE